MKSAAIVMSGLGPFAAAHTASPASAAVHAPAARSIAVTSAYVPSMLAASRAAGGPEMAPAQFTTASGATSASSAPIAAGPPSASRCCGEPGSGDRPAVTTSRPAARAPRQTCAPRNPPAPMINTRMRQAPLRRLPLIRPNSALTRS